MNRRLIAMVLGIERWPSQCFGPVRGQPFGVLRMEPVVTDHVVGEDAGVPGVRQPK